MEESCCICGPIKNCAHYLEKVIENMNKIKKLFKNAKIVLYYDHSTDNTLWKLKELNKKYNFDLYINNKPLSKFRTHNIANARNFLLNYVKKKKFDFMIMMDMDDVNCKSININTLKKYFVRNDWDALSFNTTPKYYDVWAASITPFTFSYNHFKNNIKYHSIITNYIDQKLKALPEGKLLRCLSSFNGFSIYRMSKFYKSKYIGKPCPNLVPRHLLDKHKLITNSNIIYKKYPNVDGRFEDCEHRAFHLLAIHTKRAKICISPDILFF